MTGVDKIVNLGVIRLSNSSCSDHFQAVAAKAMRAASVIRCAYSNGAQKLLYLVLYSYVSPLLMYCSPVYTLNAQRDINNSGVRSQTIYEVYMRHTLSAVY